MKQTVEKRQLYTVGHSNQSVEEFFQLLESQRIDCLLDVRSMPYSKYTPQFNEDNLKAWLGGHGVMYAPFGKHFGARRTDCLKEVAFVRKGKTEVRQQVDFELGTTTPDFLQGVDRLNKALDQGRRVALMCSEADPLGCHRFSFLSRYFYDMGWDVRHIVRDEDSGEPAVRTHEELERTMILDYVKHHKLKALGGQMGDSLFMDFGDGYDEQQQRRDAYRLKNHEIGWVPEHASDDNEEDY